MVPFTECQLACEHLPKCEYFVYDKDSGDCELLNAPKRTCDILRGPHTPNYEQCMNSTSTIIPTPSTSSTPTTSTPTTSTPSTPSTSFHAPSDLTQTTAITTLTTQSLTSSKLTESSTTPTHLPTTDQKQTSTPEPPTKYRIMVVGGVNGQGNRLSDVELIDPTNANSNCEKPPSFPYNVLEMVSEIYNGKALVCGGLSDKNEPHRDCYQYFQNWQPGPDNLAFVRYRASSVLLDDGNIWILGGDGDFGESTTSEILNSKGEFELGPVLPEPTQSHCTARINSTHVFFAGNGVEPQTQAYIVDTSKETFHFFKLPNMHHKRFGAACSVILDPIYPNDYRYTKLIVGGGDAPTYSSTEMYTFLSNAWTEGPSLLRGFHFGGYLNYPDSNNGFILIGGRDSSDTYRTDMMWYNHVTNKFEVLPGRLETARGDFGVALHQSTDDC